MFALLTIFSSFGGSDIDRLGSENFQTRESAEWRLRVCGWLAVPALLRAAHSESPEVRQRVGRLLAPRRSEIGYIRAAKILLSPWMPERSLLCDDTMLRDRVFRLAEKCGWTNYYYGWEGWGQTEYDELTPDELERLLESSKRQLGYPSWDSWPFTSHAR